MRISTRATSAFAARRGVRARDARQRHNCPTRFEIAIKLERATRANKCGAPMLSVAEFSRVRARVWSLLLARGTSSSGPRGPLELEMSILCCLKPGEARTRASEPAREPECNALIVHPLFVSDLTRDLLPNGLAPGRGHLERPRTPGAPHSRPLPRSLTISTRTATHPARPRPPRLSTLRSLPILARLPAFPGWRRRRSVQRGESPHEAPVRGRRPLA